jgi:hypothetical protein
MEEVMQVQLVDKIRPLYSVFDLKSGAHAKLVDRSGPKVIIEVEKLRSDWIEWSEVEPRIVIGTGMCKQDFVLYDQAVFCGEIE